MSRRKKPHKRNAPSSQPSPSWPPLTTGVWARGPGSLPHSSKCRLQGSSPGPAPHSTRQVGLQLRLWGGGQPRRSGRKMGRSWPGIQRGSPPGDRPKSPVPSVLPGMEDGPQGLAHTSHLQWRSDRHRALPHSHPGHPEAPCALEAAFWLPHYALPAFWRCHCLRVGRRLLGYDSQQAFQCFPPSSSLGVPCGMSIGKRSLGPAMHLRTWSAREGGGRPGQSSSWEKELSQGSRPGQ